MNENDTGMTCLSGPIIEDSPLMKILIMIANRIIVDQRSSPPHNSLESNDEMDGISPTTTGDDETPGVQPGIQGRGGANDARRSFGSVGGRQFGDPRH